MKIVNTNQCLRLEREIQDPFVCDGPCNKLVAKDGYSRSIIETFLVDNALYCKTCFEKFFSPAKIKPQDFFKNGTNLWKALGIDKQQRYIKATELEKVGDVVVVKDSTPIEMLFEGIENVK